MCTLEPWTIPAVFSRSALVVGTPRITIPPSQAKSKEIVVNPDTLRQFGSTVDALMKEIGAVRSGSQDIQMRISLQQVELDRQVRAAAALSADVSKLKAFNGDLMKERIESTKARQRDLLRRMDRVVQLHMDAACPMLSKAESEWFEEIRRTKRQVQGQDTASSLEARTELVGTV
jgi:nucleoporin NUP82